MKEYTLNVRTGNSSLDKWQDKVGELYSIAMSKDMNSLKKIFTELSEIDPSFRWELVEGIDNTPFLSSGQHSNGIPYSWKIVLPFTRLELLFALNEWAFGTNKNIIGHLLMYKGKLTLLDKFDPSILKYIKRHGESEVYGWDILSISAEDILGGHSDGIANKRFLSNEQGSIVYCGSNSQQLPHVPMVLATLLHRKMKANPGHCLADVVNHHFTGEWIEGMVIPEKEEE